MGRSWLRPAPRGSPAARRAARRQRLGRRPQRSKVALLADQFKDFMVLVLLGAAVVSAWSES